MLQLLLLSLLVSSTSALSDASIFTTRPPDPRALDASAYGAVGDGLTDDTLALQRALNATYTSSSPDCTHPGSRQLFLEGNGKRYLLSSSLLLWTWVRLIGWGASRPVLLLAPSTPAFSNASTLLPLIRVIDGTPPGTKPCTSNPSDGGNTAFGVGVMNVDFVLSPLNPGGVALRWRAAQGGLLRALRIDLAEDSPAAIHSPGWAHEDLHIVGGRTGILVNDTGAWPSIFRDSVFEGQSVAGVGWDASSVGTSHSSAWEGVTLVRSEFVNAPAAVSASGVLCARITLLQCLFTNLSVVVAPPSFSGNSSLLIRDSGGSSVPLLLGASDAGPALPSPGGGAGAFTLKELTAGAQTADVRAPGGTALRIQVTSSAAPASLPPPLPPRDTFSFPPTATWITVTSHGLVGDGLTDNAAALLALLSSLPPYSTLFFPTGVYIIASPIALPHSATLLGLSCWDVVLSLPDHASAFSNASALQPFLSVTSASTWLVGLNIRTGVSFTPSNPNPGTLAVLWSAPTGGLHDVFFHPPTFPDNPRVLPNPQTELSLVISGGGGVFSDVWSCNAYSLGGVRVLDTAEVVTFYQLSSEHHAGGEVLLSNATGVAIHTMQTEDRSPDAAPTASLLLTDHSSADVTGLFSYYAANVSSAAAVAVSADSSLRLAVFRQWHSYHPMFYNCSLLAEVGGGGEACVQKPDLAFAGAH